MTGVLQLKPLVPAAMIAVNATKFVTPEVIMATWAKGSLVLPIAAMATSDTLNPTAIARSMANRLSTLSLSKKTQSSWLIPGVLVKILKNLKRRSFGAKV